MKNYVRYQDYFKTHLGGWSFEDGDETLTIKNIDEKEMYDADTGGKKKGLVIYFREKELPLVLNVTNSETIAEVCGSDKFADWIGKRIIVGQSRIKAFGKVQDVVRVRDTVPDDTTYICEECGAVIKPTKTKQPSEIAEVSKRNLGRVLCVACMKKYKEENNAE